MATDINQILKSAQDTINSAVEAISETRKTQDLLEKNIQVTDTKIAVHNKSTDCHDDIRLRLEDMPAMIQDPVISGPSAIYSGDENTWTFTAQPTIPSVSVSKFIVVDHEGKQYTVNAAEGSGTFTHTFTGEQGAKIYFTVKAKGTYDYVSKAVRQDITVTKHVAPDMSQMQTTLPKVVSAGKTYTFRVSNITDANQDFKHYLLECSDANITLPAEAKTGMTLDKDYNLSVAADHYGPGTVNFTIKAVDNKGLTSTSQITARLNAKPDVSSVVHTIPTYLAVNSSVLVRFQGASDTDKDTITYGISSSNPAISFTKDTGINEGEDVTLKVGSVNPGTSVDFTITVTDQYGATNTKKISSKINTAPDISKLQIVLNKEVYIPGDTGTITITGATDADAGQNLTYSIKDTNGKIVWGKKTDIKEGEVVTLNIDPSIPRGNYSFDVIAVDMVGSGSTRTVAMRINTLPNIQTLQHTLPAEVVPGRKITCKVFGATDIDPKQNLKYSITSKTENVILENATNIDANALFSITPPTDKQLARGKPITLTISVSDGLESVTKDITTKQNALPNVSGVNPVLPAGGIIESGITHKAKISIPPATDVVTYSIIATDPKLVFDKTKGIKPNEQVGVLAKGVSANTIVKFTIAGVDALGETGPGKEVSVTIKPWMVTAAPNITKPADNAVVADQKGNIVITWDAYKAVPWLGDGNYPNG